MKIVMWNMTPWGLSESSGLDVFYAKVWKSKLFQKIAIFHPTKLKEVH